MRALFVYNPKAGKAMIRNKLSDILELLEQGAMRPWCVPPPRAGMPAIT